jgi:hypothetical protein
MPHALRGAFWLTCVVLAGGGGSFGCAPPANPPPSPQSGVLTETGPTPSAQANPVAGRQAPNELTSVEQVAPTERSAPPRSSASGNEPSGRAVERSEPARVPPVPPEAGRPTITISRRPSVPRSARETEGGRIACLGVDDDLTSNSSGRNTPAVLKDANGRVYTGPDSGVILWSARLEQDEVVIIDGRLPGVPVTIMVEASEFEIVEPPSSATGWNRFSIRSKGRRTTTARIQWIVLR